MKKNIKFQIKLMLSEKSFFATLLIGICFSCISVIYYCIINFNRGITDVPNAASFFLGSGIAEVFFIIFSIIFPLLIVMPFADSYYKEKAKNMLGIIMTKTSRKKYYFSKMVAVFLSGALVVFVPLMLSFLLGIAAFPLNSTCDFTMFPLYDSDFYTVWIANLPFKSLFCKNVYIYNLMYMIISSIAGGALSLIAYNFSFFVKKQYFLCVTSVFILTNIISIISSILPSVLLNFGIDLKGSSFNLFDYIFAFQQGANISLEMFIVTVAFYFLLILCPIPFALRKLEDII